MSALACRCRLSGTIFRASAISVLLPTPEIPNTPMTRTAHDVKTQPQHLLKAQIAVFTKISYGLRGAPFEHALRQ